MTMPSFDRSEFSYSSITILGLFAIGFIIVYPIALTIYNLFFHPLRKFPGPRFAAATRLYYDYWTFAGVQPHKTRAWHEQYGDIVRIAPSQLSFVNERAWKDIYMHQQGRPQLQKVELLPVKKRAPDLLGAPDGIHARQRKMVSHAFSDRNLREQEPMLKGYIDNLVRNFADDAQAGKVTNVIQEYNFTTFDIIGDFAFGESFHMLETRQSHPFIQLLFAGTRFFTQLTAFANSFSLHELVRFLATQGEKVAPFNPMEFVHEKVGARIASGELQRPDLFTNILRAKAEMGDMMPRDEIDSVAATLMGAGSETTATHLSAITYLLLSNPSWKQRLIDEVRKAYDDVSDITIARASILPVLNACVEECLRLYPPVPVVMARITPLGGTVICGHFVPENMVVGIPFYASHTASSNFTRPLEFHPERWLPEGAKEFAQDRKGSLQPFSAGPRNCIGRNLAYAEIKLIVSRVFYQFDMVLAEPELQWREQTAFTLWEKSPLMVHLKDRLS